MTSTDTTDYRRLAGAASYGANNFHLAWGLLVADLSQASQVECGMRILRLQRDLAETEGQDFAAEVCEALRQEVNRVARSSTAEDLECNHKPSSLRIKAEKERPAVPCATGAEATR